MTPPRKYCKLSHTSIPFANVFFLQLECVLHLSVLYVTQGEQTVGVSFLLNIRLRHTSSTRDPVGWAVKELYLESLIKKSQLELDARAFQHCDP